MVQQKKLNLKVLWRSHKEGITALLVLFVIVGLWWCWAVALAPRLQARIQADFERAQRATPAKSVASAPASAPATNQAPAMSTSDYFSRLGQTGDLFGAVNALFATFAVAGVFWAGALQRRTMLETRQAIEQQQFETAFFELLKLTREVIQLFEYTYLVSPAKATAGTKTEWTEQTARGYAALNAIAHIVFKNDGLDQLSGAPRVQGLVHAYKQKIYHEHPAALGPYFRLLFQTFQLVANAPVGEEMRIQYSKIARGQLSEGAVLLLALNGLTWRGREFVTFIEQFGLLEHMHPSFLKRFRGDFLLAYRRRAFLGSKERHLETNNVTPVPGPFAFDQDPDQPNFVMSRPFDDDVAKVDAS